jgi:hypothetical protein
MEDQRPLRVHFIFRAAEVLDLDQSADRPDPIGDPSRLETMPS